MLVLLQLSELQAVASSASPCQLAPVMACPAETSKLELDELSAGEEETQQPGVARCHDCAKSFPLADLTGRWRKNQKLCQGCRRTEHCLWRHVGVWGPVHSAQTNATRSLLRAAALPLGQPWRPTWSKASAESALSVTVGGKYLPSNVWLAQGFTQDQVDHCQDWEDNDTLGKCYRLSVKEVSHSSVLRTVRKEVVNRVKEVTKNRKDLNKTWDVQTSSCGKNSTPEGKASKQASREVTGQR